MRQPELAAKTVAGYRWALELHLLPEFARKRLSEITVQAVDRYKSAKAREGCLGHAQINKTLKVLAMILETAQEYGHLDPNLRNPASGRRRRLKEPKPRRTWVEPEQLPSLLEAADPNLRPILATLAGAGLRIGEAVALRWRDVNVATGTITVRESKTDAGTGREVDLPLGLADELRAHKARCRRTGPSDRVFVNRSDRPQTIRNVEARIKTAIADANERLDRLGIEPLSARVTPHSLRRTYASLRFAKGDDSVQVAEQLGHTDGAFSQAVYAKAVKRRQRLSGNYLTEFDQALEWAEMGRNHDLADTLDPLADAPDPAIAGVERKPTLGPDSSAG